MNECRICHAKIGGELDATMRRLKACKNCRIDIQMDGQWTGAGFAIVSDLVKRYGRDAVIAAEARLEKKGHSRTSLRRGGRRGWRRVACEW